jgi:pullulanase/glycogen debranching enzyme
MILRMTRTTAALLAVCFLHYPSMMQTMAMAPYGPASAARVYAPHAPVCAGRTETALCVPVSGGEARAEMVGPRHVRLLLHEADDDALDASRYRLVTSTGKVIPIESVTRVGSAELHLRPCSDLDPRRVCHLLLDAGDTLLCSFDGWMRRTYSGKELGAGYHPDAGNTVVRVFSPRADSVRLYLYRSRVSNPADVVVSMVRDDDGVWEATVAGDYERWWYDFTVHGPEDPGNEYFEQVPVHVTDPYARVSDDSFGRARIWPRTTPPPPVRGGRPRMEDVIAYEVHLEDFTYALAQLAPERRGKLTGFVTPGVRNTRGAPVGFDHLLDLGINVVHLMPVQEFLHYPDAEWRRAFSDDPYMREQMVAESCYEWGYRTSHAFAIESRYREQGSDAGAQNTQLRDLVAAFHEQGIAVIVDMVFNHTAERMDGREMYFNLRVFDRHAYYRTDDRLGFIGAYGTETKSEDRPMAARWIFDQCAMLVDEYGIDGFRIDLAGLTDEATLRELRRRLGPDIIIYGEPWIASSDPRFERNPGWDWYKEDAPITFFQDDCRNALCGPPDNPRDKKRDRGYAGGNGDRQAAKRAIANSFDFEDNPNEGINYLDIHDNWSLADRFAATDWNGLLGVDEGPYRIAAAMLLTSLGPVVIHGGSEFMRSKGSSPLVEYVKRTESGPIYIHGMRDTYNLRRPNLFLWESLGWNIEDGAACNYQRMNDYWKGLIALRRSKYGEVLRRGEAVPSGYIRWIEPENPMLLGYVIGNGLAVIINTSDQPQRVAEMVLPEGDWTLVAAGDRAGTTPITGHAHATLTGGAHVLTLAPFDVNIWIRK